MAGAQKFKNQRAQALGTAKAGVKGRALGSRSTDRDH